ncbi:MULTISPECIES: NADPH-dependent FMN reductase [unclassified Oceanobacillus]|uniref:NADPH-dependent FMN reductase n=1 Tax=unclassified Oceanobacillus TaxID=2630292 RepID=UPI0012ECB37D|nr:NAD(P)H-dependent oxidoreductase [Oceanobacillus sp. AG]
MTKVGIVVGSIRNNSFSEQLAKNIVELFPAGYEAEFVEIADLPLYNQDSDENIPEVYTNFRNTIKGLDAVIFVTPEHNRSIPAALKNALDVGSRPYGSNVWDGKPALIVSQSPSNLSGFGANHHLRQVLAFLNMPVVQQPEVYIANVHELLGEDGKVTNQDTIGFLQSVVDAYVSFIKRHES